MKLNVTIEILFLSNLENPYFNKKYNHSIKIVGDT